MYEEKEITYWGLIYKIGFYLSINIYFLYHIFGGEYGIFSYKDVNKDIIREESILDKKKIEIEKRQNKIDRLKNNNIDLDLLDEELKRNVGIIDKNEIILFIDDLKNI